MKIALKGNCQVLGISDCLKLMLPDAEVIPIVQYNDSNDPIYSSDIIFYQDQTHEQFYEEIIAEQKMKGKVFVIPNIHYLGFHPDVVFVRDGDTIVTGPMGHYQSQIVMYGWLNGLS
jgi:hypothetical protein